MRILNGNFVDENNRIVSLRGVNLSGISKNPIGDNSKTLNRENITFVDRPFPLHEAHCHFARLKSWGFNFIRYCITWEAIEHKGPGNYDEEYIDYVLGVLTIGQQYQFTFFIDPHQDTWSRFTGGSGAPYWTLQVVGLNDAHFYETGAALTHKDWCINNNTPFPTMIWPTNYNKLACGTMFTIFFAGNTFAPKCLIQFNTYTQSIQDFLQESFINSFSYLFFRINQHKLNCVVGFDSLNEPSHGFINCPLNQMPSNVHVFLSNTPTLLQSLRSGNGQTQTITKYSSFNFINIPSKTTINKTKVSAWLQEPIHPHLITNEQKQQHHLFHLFTPLKLNRIPTDQQIPSMSWKGCIWSFHDVYTSKSFNNSYFLNHNFDDFWLQFVELECIQYRLHSKDLICFLDPPVMKHPPIQIKSTLQPCCYSPHWYDGLTLMSKSFPIVQVNAISYFRHNILLGNIYFGTRGIRQCFTDQVAHLNDDSTLLKTPMLLGETGLQFDMNDKWMMISSDDRFTSFAYDCYFRAFERNLTHFTLWHYNPDTTWHGDDDWNDENLSIIATKLNSPICNSTDCQKLRFSEPFDQFESTLRSLNASGRCLNAIIRPYSYCTPGRPLKIRFNFKTKYFYYAFIPLEFNSKVNICELYLPRYHYEQIYILYNQFHGQNVIDYLETNGIVIKLSQGSFTLNEVQQKLLWTIDGPSTIANHKNSKLVHPEQCSLEIFWKKDMTWIERVWHKCFGDEYGYTPQDFLKFFHRQ